MARQCLIRGIIYHAVSKDAKLDINHHGENGMRSVDGAEDQARSTAYTDGMIAKAATEAGKDNEPKGFAISAPSEAPTRQAADQMEAA